MMYSIRMGKTAYDTQNENSANHYAVHSQLWNIDRNADADNVVCKIDEMIYINGIICDRHIFICAFAPSMAATISARRPVRTAMVAIKAKTASVIPISEIQVITLTPPVARRARR